ncbi:hypothetical protein G6O69_35510 [Pseudenhygromyxa sp. WMMC2535]|uniref:hypothetical protein n=1 Tax=Pseudenhygromyxa sp. WMMC2535 TaxID=2712867 RepID=UPI00155691FC|nr:hypothetical protein [Pseudenhygromyxa sp. WMMC2535]NVB43186.1 hypothetical protein [Pseudenhygromyxa sp. WMMC2535]
MAALLTLLLCGVGLQPPALPPEPSGETPDASEQVDGSAPASSDASAERGESAPRATPDSAPADDSPTDARPPLPEGIEVVPFPLDSTPDARAQTGATNDASANQREAFPPPVQRPRTQRRSVVDLRDPFHRPPTRPLPRPSRAATERLMMPELKDPFAPGVRRVRSQTLSLPDELRDPFRDRPTSRPACTRTTDNGVTVQIPAGAKGCERARTDLRDPFVRSKR